MPTAKAVFKINNGNAETSIDVTLNGLTITGAELPLAQSDTSGGGILTRENLELNNSKISGNAAVISGGGIYSSGSKLIINNSTIEDNSAFLPVAVSTSEGGGIATVGTTVEINDMAVVAAISMFTILMPTPARSIAIAYMISNSGKIKLLYR